MSRAILELALFAAILVADALGIIPLTNTPLLVALAWGSLALRRRPWRDLGWRWPERGGRALALGAAAGLMLSLVQLGVVEPLLTRWTGVAPDLTQFRRLEGNLGWALVGLAVAWGLAAVGEELAFRGYLLDRLAGLGGHSARAFGVALVASSVIFGASHDYQGWTGMMVETSAGLALGGLYLASGRNLLVPIVAHGVQDTVDVVLLYLGLYPGAS
jgi:hypothetical protein